MPYENDRSIFIKRAALPQGAALTMLALRQPRYGSANSSRDLIRINTASVLAEPSRAAAVHLAAVFLMLTMVLVAF